MRFLFLLKEAIDYVEHNKKKIIIKISFRLKTALLDFYGIRSFSYEI